MRMASLEDQQYSTVRPMVLMVRRRIMGMRGFHRCMACYWRGEKREGRVRFSRHSNRSRTPARVQRNLSEDSLQRIYSAIA